MRFQPFSSGTGSSRSSVLVSSILIAQILSGVAAAPMPASSDLELVSRKEPGRMEKPEPKPLPKAPKKGDPAKPAGPPSAPTARDYLPEDEDDEAEPELVVRAPETGKIPANRKPKKPSGGDGGARHGPQRRDPRNLPFDKAGRKSGKGPRSEIDEESILARDGKAVPIPPLVKNPPQKTEPSGPNNPDAGKTAGKGPGKGKRDPQSSHKSSSKVPPQMKAPGTGNPNTQNARPAPGAGSGKRDLSDDEQLVARQGGAKGQGAGHGAGKDDKKSQSRGGGETKGQGAGHGAGHGAPILPREDADSVPEVFTI